MKRNEKHIECSGLSVGYDSRIVVDNVTMDLRTGEICCFIGQNGRGKTTLFRTMLGLIAPIGGTIRLNGRPLHRWSAIERARMVAYVPQAHQGVFPFSVRDVVLFGRTAHLGLFASPGSHDRKIAEQAIEMLGIGHLAERPFPEISGGERQMVLLARALAQEASMMILDEPSSNLDYGNQVLLLRKIRELAQYGIGIAMATHSPEHALQLEARVAAIVDGGLRVWENATDALNPEDMKRVYGIDINMASALDAGGKPLRFLYPISS
ncbi:ABC transporter ATP-binding protein [Chlorobium sp. N1]|uniref:ABC transporter ATP-binding protein n=1 Tax=Chlorobium sp. N1 TaxID=2491138 RepID=UPI00103B4106|nr:ABC transporter ATP-binding protein [Chlorobium sp. N1]TCD47465.1 ABC transporter ATP-binding protein [Chlorobium sp. N1]